MAQTFYGENLTYEDTFAGNTSSYIWMNETFPNGTETNITFYHEEILHTDVGTDLDHYTFSGTGGAFLLNVSECLHGPSCIVLEGTSGGGTELPTITHDTVDIDLAQSLSPVFTFSYIDIDLESGKNFELFFFDGAVFNSVFLYNGTNNGASLAGITITDWQTVTIPLLPIYRHINFRWFVRGSMSSGSSADAVVFEGGTINETQNTTFEFPVFMRDVVTNVRIDALNITMFMASSDNVSYVSRFIHHGTSLFVHDTNSSVDGEQNFTVPVNASFLLLEAGDTAEHVIFGDLNLNQNITFSFQGERTPYSFMVGQVLSQVNFTGYQFDNASSPPTVNMTLQSLNPIISLQLIRDGNDLGFMSFCSADIYCLSDVSFPQIALQVNYTFVATDSFSLNHSFTVQQNNTVPVRILAFPNFNGEIFIPLNVSTLFSVTLLDTSNFIVSDAMIAVSFPSLSQIFNLSYNGATQTYDANLLFANEGNFPFTILNQGAFYELDHEVNGTAHVREPTNICFQIFTDRNLSAPYENNLATVLAYPQPDDSIFKFGEQIGIWTDGSSGFFNRDAFHAPYTNGEACMDMFEVHEGYEMYLLQGIMSFQDNFDPPAIQELTGTILFLGNITIEPDTTYKVYATRAEVTYGAIVNEFGTLILFGLFLGIALAVAMWTGSPLAGFGMFLFFFVFWLFVEVFIWVFT